MIIQPPAKGLQVRPQRQYVWHLPLLPSWRPGCRQALVDISKWSVVRGRRGENYFEFGMYEPGLLPDQPAGQPRQSYIQQHHVDPILSYTHRFYYFF